MSNFINKTYQILLNASHEAVIGWAPQGNSFVIRDIKKFEEHILPIYFKHSNFSSFVRQVSLSLT